MDEPLDSVMQVSRRKYPGVITAEVRVAVASVDDLKVLEFNLLLDIGIDETHARRLLMHAHQAPGSGSSIVPVRFRQ